MPQTKEQLQEYLRRLIMQALDEFHSGWRLGNNLPQGSAVETLEKWTSGTTKNYRPTTFTAFLDGLKCSTEQKKEMRDVYYQVREYEKPRDHPDASGEEDNRYLGVQTVSTKRRADTFQALSNRARNHLMIMGVGMSAVSSTAQERLKTLSQTIAVDFLMLDPDMIVQNSELDQLVNSFFATKFFVETVRLSYQRLELLCEEHNRIYDTPRMRLRVYRTIPTNSMVLIDLWEPHSEIEVEFHLYRNNETRPRLTVASGDELSLYGVFVKSYLALWNSAKVIIE